MTTHNLKQLDMDAEVIVRTILGASPTETPSDPEMESPEQYQARLAVWERSYNLLKVYAVANIVSGSPVVARSTTLDSVIHVGCSSTINGSYFH